VSLSVDLTGGELLVVLATAVPTELPTATPGVVATSTPLLWLCGTAVPGETCQWPNPTATPTPVPVCDTPLPGARCAWPTEVGGRRSEVGGTPPGLPPTPDSRPPTRP
jgi:hypothetical protein